MIYDKLLISGNILNCGFEYYKDITNDSQFDSQVMGNERYKANCTNAWVVIGSGISTHFLF